MQNNPISNNRPETPTNSEISSVTLIQKDDELDESTKQFKGERNTLFSILNIDRDYFYRIE